ncbi:MAG TPA: hypothetical protein DEH25_15350, partial [Chloroflexi bacterium]|nr:hypothetical protein [Chloroflexota bacterium]
MDAQLTLTTLGALTIQQNGEPLTAFSSHKAEALLIYLVVEKGTAQRRESLFTLLWPGMPEASARHNLRQVLYALRQAISPLLLADRNTVQIDPQAAVHLDVQEFERHLAALQAHEHLNLYGCEACTRELQQAVELYSGDFLSNFYLEDSTVFEDWAAARRAAYRAQALEALETLSEIRIQQGEYDSARSYAEQQLQIDPLREIAYRQLMELLSKSGQRAEALRVYQQCAQKLEIELGTHPSRETTALFEIIRGEDTRQATPLPEGALRGYEIREHLGTGHAAAVYRAFQPVIGRDVAIKVILPQFANHPDFIRRFEVEAQLVARLEHPYIVPLYDYWRDPSGAYLVMRWLKGGNLQSALELGPWKPASAVKLVEQVGTALALAHQQGVVHCDIKPANILLDDEGNAYLTDFGIAILTGPLAQLSQHLHTSSISSPGSLGYSPPEAARGQPPTPLADIYSLGVVLFELLCGAYPFPGVEGEALVQKHLTEPLPSVLALRPELPEAVDAVIQRATAKDPTARYPNVEVLAQEFRRALIPESATFPEVAEIKIVARNPYKGLHPFAEADALDFFGREELVARLLDRFSPASQIAEPARFLAVVGPSGSGKSSVIKAGLIPTIRRGAITGSENWFVAEMTPGAHPLEELENALLRIAIETPDDLLTQLSTDPRGLLRLLRRALPGVKSEVLLVIDQFEELYTLVEAESERSYFLELLSAAVYEPHSPLRLLITLRADFYDRPLEYSEFGELVRGATEVVLPLTPKELERAVCGPAEGVGAKLEGALLTRIVQDIGDQPGALPLLQYALTETFEKREKDQLTLSAYEASGGVLGALGRRAEEIYSRLTAAQQSAAHQMFLRLVTLGEGIEDTRRRVLRAEIEAVIGQEPSLLLPVIEQYGRHRLLTFDHDPATRAPTVEVAHEALLREWPRLRAWLDESRSDIRMQRLLGAATQEWLAAEKTPGYLLRGARLDQFSLWLDDTNLALTTNERAYLSASLEAREARQTAEAQRQTHEAQLEQRSRRFLRALVGVFAVAALIAIILSGVAFNQSSIAQENAATATFAQGEALVLADSRATQQAIAEEQAAARATQQAIAEQNESARATQQALAEDQAQQRAAAEAVAQDNLHLERANELGMVSLNLMEKQPDLAFLLSVEAYRQADTLQNWTALYTVGTNNPRLLRVIHGHQSRIEILVFSPDGKTIASGAENGTVRLWDMDEDSPTFGNSEELPLKQKVPPIEGLAFSPDGQLLAASTADGRVLAGSPPDINHVLIWDVNPASPTNQQLLVDQITEGYIWGMSRVSFSPTDPILAVTKDERVEFLDADPDSSTFGQSLGSIMNTNMWVYLNEVFSPDGTTLAIGGIGEAVTLWRVNQHDLSTSQLVLRTPFSCCANGMAYSLDGKQLFFGGDENFNFMVWDVDENSLTYGEVLATLEGHEWYAPNISLSPDGKILASAGSRDATVRLWDVDPESTDFGQQIGPALQHGGLVDSVAFSPDGKT